MVGWKTYLKKHAGGWRVIIIFAFKKQDRAGYSNARFCNFCTIIIIIIILALVVTIGSIPLQISTSLEGQFKLQMRLFDRETCLLISPTFQACPVIWGRAEGVAAVRKRPSTSKTELDLD